MDSPHSYVVEGILDKAYEVEKEIISDLERKGYDDNAIFSIRLAMDEALINGLKHGNKNNPNQCLKINYAADDNAVKISVEDEGEGFNYQNLADPTEKDYLRRPHGRGIFLIRKFMNKVEFNKKGNCITFTFQRKKKPTESGEIMGLHWLFKDNLLLLTLAGGHEESGHTEQWKEHFKDCLLRDGLKAVIDLGRLIHINTTLLSFLVYVAQEIKLSGGGCSLCVPHHRVKEVLLMTNLDQLISIHPDLDSAVQSLAN